MGKIFGFGDFEIDKGKTPHFFPVDHPIRLLTYTTYMSKYKCLATNRDRFMHQKTQEFSPYNPNDRNYSERKKDLLLPIDKFPKKAFLAGKPIRSQGKTSERIGRMAVVDVFSFKDVLFKQQAQSMHLKKDSAPGPRETGYPAGHSMQLKNISSKKSSTNRLLTEKISSVDKKQSSANRILIRGGRIGKDLSPSRRNMLKLDGEKLWVDQRMSQGSVGKDKKSHDKKLTAFEREESQNYEIYYVGSRRINSVSEFTDSEGDPKVVIGDSIAYNYEIISQLGRGSFGRVYKAYDHKKKEYIALKIIKSQEKFTIQAKVEVQILETALLHDPKLRSNIVRLKGSFVFRGHSCLKFEILHKNLYEFIKENNFSGFSLDLIRRFAIQILQALLFFSQFKIIHCDIKPENILLKEENKSGVKVIDVGSGCFENKQIYTYIQSRFYRAPEIILGVKYTTAIDMWSFGCVLIELYTGVPLFPGETENEQMLMFIQILGLPPSELLAKAERRKKFFGQTNDCKIPQPKGKEKPPRSLEWTDIVGDCDPQFIDLVKKCLQWDPAKRLTPKEGLLHDWIVSGLPKSIKLQHIEQVQNQS